jgi:hypothetical protein
VITVRAITVTAATDSKQYDGTTSSTGVPTITSGSLGTGDTANFTQAFANKNVGTGKTLTPAGSVTDGNSGNNYSVTFADNTTGVITVRAITVTAATDSKQYDGTTSSTGVPTITSGSLGSGDTANFTQAFATKSVGTGKTLTPAGSVTDGNSGNNYSVTFANNTTGAITARAITVTAATDSKGYDGTTSSTGVPTITSGSLVGGDTANFTQAFANKNVGTGKTLIPSGSVTDGNSGNNYGVTFVNNTTGSITARAITVTAATDSKQYDGTTSSTGVPTITSGTLGTGDTANFTQAFTNKNVGTGKTLLPAGSVTDGNSGNNYAVTFANNTTGVITLRAITVTAATDSKQYDGTTSSTGVPTITSGSLGAGDTANFAQAFTNKNVGTGKTLIPSGNVNDGNGGNNYSVTTANNNTGLITQLAITVTGVAATKTYDGNTSASGTPLISPGLAAGDSTTVLSQTYSTAAAGSNKSMVPAITINDGNSGNNYAVTLVSPNVGTILAKVQTAIRSAQITVIWTAYTGAANYTVQWFDPVLNTTSSTTVAGTSYVITGLVNGRTYTITVTPNPGTASVPVTATPKMF